MTTPPTYAAVPDLLDAERLIIVQAQIEALRIEAYQLEAAVAALPIDDPKLKELAANLKRARSILAGYRAQEAVLIVALNALS